MTLISVNAPHRRIEGEGQVLSALAALPPRAPVTIMIHGFRSDPAKPEHSPHAHILSFETRRDCWKAVSWPKHLHLNRPGAGLGIGFGWPALGRLDRAAAQAWRAGEALAALIEVIGRERPDASVRLIAHSLGARVALAGLAPQRPGLVEAAILLSAAEFQGAAEDAAFSPAGRAARTLNVTSGENLLFEGLFRLFAPSRDALGPSISAGLSVPHANWLDLRIDDPAQLAALRRLGYRPAPPRVRICHWSSYLRPGLFPLYRDVFARPAVFQTLRTALQSERSAPRMLRPTLPLPRGLTRA